MSVFQWASGKVFNAVHQHNLVYNTCWEDPRLDREALDLGPDDTVMVITSAGCNALDYALTGPRQVHAVDMNPRQNALLELKLAGVRELDFDTFFAMFGHGRLPGAADVYRRHLRDLVSPWSQRYWDRRIRMFDNPRRPFYFRGTCGLFARVMNAYIDRIAKVRPWMDAILDARTLEEQREIYEKYLREGVWTRPVRFLLNRDATMSLLGVPPAQRTQVEDNCSGGLLGYIESCLEAVFAQLPIVDNYFWRVYITGCYTQDCCPEYLKEENFDALKGGLADRVSVHTDSVQGFLEKQDAPISRFVLLDHMDWLTGRYYHLLESEWQAILRRAAPNARLIWRSGAPQTDFVNGVRVEIDGRTHEVGDLLKYHRELAAQLHQQCRVHTYASFHIADLAA